MAKCEGTGTKGKGTGKPESGVTVAYRHSGQRFLQGLEDKDERSISALNEALAPKQEDDVKDTGGGHRSLIKVIIGACWAKVAL